MDTIQHTDVIVLGGGSAGIAAAVAASRKGSKVILVERNPFLGGKATAAEVGTVCGLYHFSKNEKAEYSVNGFAKEFADALQQRSGTSPLHNAEGLHYLPYSIEAFKDICIEYLKQNNITVYFNAVLKTVEIKNEKIISASVIAEGKPLTISLRSLIDCSGDSIISSAAGLPLIKTGNYQAAAQVFTMEGVSEDNEARLGMIMMKALRAAIDDDLLPDFYDRVYIVQGSLKNNCVSLKIGIPLPVEDDVLQCRKFDDAIANAAWPIEEWGQHRRVSMHYFKEHDLYQVPAGCIQSADITNLFFAGRNISATEKAIASARVMGICLQTGYAAGCLASACASGMSQIDAIKAIQKDQL
jgi:hypothetical protein